MNRDQESEAPEPHVIIVPGQEFSRHEKLIFGRPATFTSKRGGPKICRGAVRAQEGRPKDAYTQRSRPAHLRYSVEKFYRCKNCEFEYKAEHVMNTSTGKERMDIDKTVHVHNGILYRWELLFRSHLKQREYLDNVSEANFACLFCYAEVNSSSGVANNSSVFRTGFGNAGTPVFKGVNAFLDHLQTHRQIHPPFDAVWYMNAIVGRCPATTEDFAVALPLVE